MRRQSAAIVVLLLLAFFAGGCSHLKVHDYNTGLMNFKGMTTYAWVSPVQPKTGNPQVDTNAMLNAAVRQEIDAALKERGYTLSDKPDFLVAYRATLDRNVSVTPDSSSGVGYNPYYKFGEAGRDPGSDTDPAALAQVNSFEQGTLVIDIVDPQTKQLVWRVTGTDAVNLKNSPERKRKNLRKVIDEMLAKFPPTTAP